MIKLLTTVIVLFGSATAFAGDTMVFIGEALMVERSAKSCQEYLSKKTNESGQLDEICIDRVFNYRYEIKEMIIGPSAIEQITFTGFYHDWGLPIYAAYKDALVVLRMSDYGYFLQGVEEATKTNSVWSICRKWSDDDEECIVSKTVEEFLLEAGYTSKNRDNGTLRARLFRCSGCRKIESNR